MNILIFILLQVQQDPAKAGDKVRKASRSTFINNKLVRVIRNAVVSISKAGRRDTRDETARKRDISTCTRGAKHGE